MSPECNFHLLVLLLFLIKKWNKLRGISGLLFFFLSLMIPSIAISKKRWFMLEGKRVHQITGAMVLRPAYCVSLTS